jgi:hypothetical protein
MVAVWRKAALYDPRRGDHSGVHYCPYLRVDLAGKASRANTEIAAIRELPMRLEASVEEMALASERGTLG